MALFGKCAPEATLGWMEAPVAAPAFTVREQHHAEILAAFETATGELAHAERLKVRAAEMAFEAGRTVDQAREAVEAQRRLLRRVAEGHI